MSLEKRIADALTATEDYQPSADLFARIHRSIEGDRAHRRRVRISVLSTLAGVTGLFAFLVGSSQRDAIGALTIPKWSLQIAILVVLTAVLMALGPALRRLGQPLVEEIFHPNPPTGARFSRLLDIAYYLFFGGLIVNILDPTRLGTPIEIPSDQLWEVLALVAGFLGVLGLAHVANLAALPVIGLLYTSLSRKLARHAAGRDAPPESPLARKADRLVTGIVIATILLVIGGVFALIGLIILGLGVSAAS